MARVWESGSVGYNVTQIAIATTGNDGSVEIILLSDKQLAELKYERFAQIWKKQVMAEFEESTSQKDILSISISIFTDHDKWNAKDLKLDPKQFLQSLSRKNQ